MSPYNLKCDGQPYWLGLRHETFQQTATSVADIDAFIASIETPARLIQAEVDRLSGLPLRLSAVDRMHTALAALRAATTGTHAEYWRPIQLVREAAALARYDGYSADAKGLLLLEARATQGMEGTLPRAQRYLQAMRYLGDQRPRLATLTTTYLYIDRHRKFWPSDRAQDPGCQAVATALEDVGQILDAEGASLARLLLAYRRMLSLQLPDRPAQGSAQDEGSFREQLAALEPGDIGGALASIALSVALWRVGLLDRPEYICAEALRLTPPPNSAGDAQDLVWLATAIADAAEKAVARARDCRLQLEVVESRLAGAGGRDRKRSELLRLLLINPVTSASRLADLAGVSRRTALTFLDRMVELGIARQIGESRGLRLVAVDAMIG